MIWWTRVSFSAIPPLKGLTFTNPRKLAIISPCAGGGAFCGDVVREFSDNLAGDRDLASLQGLVGEGVASRDPKDRRGFTAQVNTNSNLLAMDWTDRGKCWRKLTGEKLAHLGGDGGTDTKITRGGSYRYEAQLAKRDDGTYVTRVRLFAGSGANERVLSDWTEVDGDVVAASGDPVSGSMGKRSSKRSSWPLILALLLGFLGGAWFGLNNGDVDTSETIDIRPAMREAGITIPDDPDLSADLEASQQALAGAQARIGELEQALANEAANSDALRSELESLRASLNTVEPTNTSGPTAGSGLSLAPCWINAEGSFEAGTHADYIYDVHLSDDGIKVSKTFGADRDNDYAALPIAAVTLDETIDRYTFAAQFVPLFDASVAGNCRHFVRVYEGQHASADLYKAQRDAVEGFFYIYRPHQTRY